jgi:hypothetical protein
MANKTGFYEQINKQLTPEFTCAGFAPDVSINDNFAAQPRLIKSQD